MHRVEDEDAILHICNIQSRTPSRTGIRRWIGAILCSGRACNARLREELGRAKWKVTPPTHHCEAAEENAAGLPVHPSSTFSQ